ncbi:MAG: ABC transporter permease [Pseudomonadota bacterium]
MSAPPETRAREAQPVAAPEPAVDVSRRVTVIRPSPRWPHLDVREFWHFRELFGMLVWRDVKVRYKQTFIGIAWAIVQPLMLMVVFSLVFGKFAQFSSEGLPYQVFTYSGLLPWTYFASALALSSVSVVSNTNLVTKVYFPRVFLPFAASAVPAIDFALAFVVLIGLMQWFHVPVHATVVFMPAFLLLAFVTALGVGLFFSAMNVRYRDVPYALPFVVQLWMWLSPVAYAITELPDRYEWIFALNPMTGVINGFRWSLLGTPAPPPGQLAVSVAAAIVFFLGGLAFFRRSEPRFADTI